MSLTQQHQQHAPKNTFKLIKYKKEELQTGHTGESRFKIGMVLFNYLHKLMFVKSLGRSARSLASLCEFIIVCICHANITKSPDWELAWQLSFNERVHFLNSRDWKCLVSIETDINQLFQKLKSYWDYWSGVHRSFG